MDNVSAAKRYEKWRNSPKGAFSLAREQRLIAEIVSPWQRRNHALLEIGCGSGRFLEQFYLGGFDVTGIDSCPDMLEEARKRMGQKAVLRCGSAERLPFEDNEFDYVALVTPPEYMDDTEAVLAEAFRVSTRGVLVAYRNSWSILRLEAALCSLGKKFRSRFARNLRRPETPETQEGWERMRWFNLLQMWRMIYKVSSIRPRTFRSTLFSPSIFWRGVRPFSLPWAQMAPFGAFVAVRVDIVPVCATPIVLSAPRRARAAQAHAGAVTMERFPQSKEK